MACAIDGSKKLATLEYLNRYRTKRRAAKTHRRALVEENQHSAANRRRRSRVKAAGGKFDSRLNLLAIQPLKPFHDVLDIGSGFQIFEDDGDRHAGTTEYPGAAYLSWDAFDHGALGPIER